MKTKFLFKPLIIQMITVAVLVGCSPKKNPANLPKPFPKVSLPMIVGSEEESLAYMAKNYWNAYFDSVKVFSQDTALIGGVTPSDFNMAYNEYVRILQNTPLKTAYEAQRRLITKAEEIQKNMPDSKIFISLKELSEQIIYGVNSDFRNEELYIPILETLSTTELLDSSDRAKYQRELANCSLNRVGRVASDFDFTTKEGKHSSLHKITADFTLLFFSNPGCAACKEIIDNFKSSEKIQQLIGNKTLVVLNMYIDEDLTEWFKYMPIYPDNWINAYDPNHVIRDLNSYDVRAIPSLYLLDKEKRVIYKDAPPYLIFNRLMTIQSL